PDRGGKDEAAQHRYPGKLRRPAGKTRDELRGDDAAHDPGEPAAEAEEHGFGEELKQHLQAARADRHAQPDLARALGNRDQKNIHDADAADEERDRGDGRKKKRHDPAAAFRGAGDLAQVADIEVFGVARADAMTAQQRLRHLLYRRLNQLGARRLDENLIDVAGEARRQPVRVGRRRIGGGDRRLLLRRRGDAQDAALGGGEGHHEEIVLVLAERCLALGGEDADDAQRHAFHLNGRADRVFVFAEELAIDRLTDDADQRTGAVVLLREGAAGGDLPIGGIEIARGDTLDAGRPVAIAELHLTQLADDVADLRDRFVFSLDRLRIGDGKGRGAAEARAHPAGRN